MLNDDCSGPTASLPIRLLAMIFLGMLAFTDVLWGRLLVNLLPQPTLEVRINSSSLPIIPGREHYQVDLTSLRLARYSDQPRPGQVKELVADRATPEYQRSRLVLLENDQPLQPHVFRRELSGQFGAYSHWGDKLYFTATDGSDPRTNGKEYRIRYPQPDAAWDTVESGLLVFGSWLPRLAKVMLLVMTWLTWRRHPTLHHWQYWLFSQPAPATSSPRSEQKTAFPWGEVLLAMIVTLLIGWIYLPTVPERIAMGGSSLLDVLGHLDHPENFQRDWPHAFLELAASGYILLLAWLQQVWHLDPLWLTNAFLVISIFGFSLVLGLITRRLFDSLAVTLLAVPILLLAPLAGKNFGVTGPFSWWIDYFTLRDGLPLVLSMVAIHGFMRRAILPAFAALGFTFIANPNIGMITAVFTLAHYAFYPGELRDRSTRLGLAGFVVLGLAWSGWVLTSMKVAGPTISEEQWTLVMRVFSIHFFSYQNGLYTTYADEYLIPILLVSLLYGVVLARTVGPRREFILMASGIITGLLLTLLTVVFEQWLPDRFLLRMGLHRASAYSSFFGTLFLINYLSMRFLNGGMVPSIAAGYSLITLCLGDPGISLRSLGMLLWLDAWHGQVGPWRLGNRWRAGMLIALGSALVAMFTTESFHFLDFLTKHERLLVGGAFPFSTGDHQIQSILFVAVLATSFIHVVRRVNHRSKGTAASRWLNAAAVVIILGLFAGVKQLQQTFPWAFVGHNLVRASAFLQTQKWAREHTPNTSLFLVDPSWMNGWRDFSERASFGSLREWLYFNTIYTDQLDIFEQGQDRARIFGVDIRGLDINTCQIGGRLCCETLANQVRERFYRLSGEELNVLRQAHGIDYVVLQKKDMRKDRHYGPPVFQNDYYVILRLGD